MATEVRKLKKDEYNNNECVLIPPVDIYETENEYVIRADMPSVKKEDLDITYHENRLDIHGKATAGSEDGDGLKYREYTLNDYHRTFNVGRDINGEAITANIENGVLTLTLPKREEAKPRKIEISAN